MRAARQAHGRLNSFTPRRNLHVVYQAYKIHQCLSGLSLDGPLRQPAIEAAEAFAEHARAITTGIAGRLTQGVCFSRQWVTIDTAAVDLRWRLTTFQDLGGMFGSLDEALDLAARLGPKSPPTTSSEICTVDAPLSVELDSVTGSALLGRPELPRLDFSVPAAPTPIPTRPGLGL